VLPPKDDEGAGDGAQLDPKLGHATFPKYTPKIEPITTRKQQNIATPITTPLLGGGIYYLVTKLFTVAELFYQLLGAHGAAAGLGGGQVAWFGTH